MASVTSPVTPATPLPSIQAGRAVAAVAVTAFHLSLMMGEARYGGVPALENWTAMGKAGVDFFFVLSGFIVLHAHAPDVGRPSALGRYLWRRFARVYPVYWLYLGVYLALLALGIGRVPGLPATAGEWASAFTLVRLSSADMPLYVAWTLFHEVAFYLAFALLIIHRGLGCAVMGAWALACLFGFHYPGQHPPSPWMTYTSMANLNFLIGMGAWALLHRGWANGALAGLGVVLVLGIPLADGLESPSGPLVMALGFGAVLAGLCALDLHATRRPAWLRWPAAWLAVGDASYSLYLLHLPLSGLLLKVFASSGALQPRVMYLVVLTLVIALAWLAYAGVERPLVQGLRRWGPPQRPTSATADARTHRTKKNAHREVGV